MLNIRCRHCLELSGTSHPTAEHPRHLDTEMYSGPKYFLLCIIWKNEQYIFSEGVLNILLEKVVLFSSLLSYGVVKIFNLIFSFCGMSFLNYELHKIPEMKSAIKNIYLLLIPTQALRERSSAFLYNTLRQCTAKGEFQTPEFDPFQWFTLSAV